MANFVLTMDARDRSQEWRNFVVSCATSILDAARVKRWGLRYANGGGTARLTVEEPSADCSTILTKATIDAEYAALVAVRDQAIADTAALNATMRQEIAAAVSDRALDQKFRDVLDVVHRLDDPVQMRAAIRALVRGD